MDHPSSRRRASREESRLAVSWRRAAACGFLLAAALAVRSRAPAQPAGPPWARHMIDNTFTGVRAFRLGTIGAGARRDLVAVWEQQGAVRFYQNPGTGAIRDPWPSVTIGYSLGAADAVFADFDGDGIPDVVTPCESGLILWHHTASRDRYLDPDAWTTDLLPDAPSAAWTVAAAANLDDRYGPDLVAGSQAPAARLGWFERLGQTGDVTGFRWHALGPAGWVSALLLYDLDVDGDLDVLVADRAGSRAGVAWFENPGDQARRVREWPRHPVSTGPLESISLSLYDLDGDGLLDIISTARPNHIWFHRRRAPHARSWQNYQIRLPDTTGLARAVRVADINIDGKLDLVLTTEHADGGRYGVVWLTYQRSLIEDVWREYNISGQAGDDFGGLELIDLDDDGDLDIITSEKSLGLIWYENPTRTPPPARSPAAVGRNAGGAMGE